MRALCWLFGVLLVGCGGAQDPAAAPRPNAPSLSAPESQRSDQLGVFGSGTVGPYLGPTRDGWLALWVEPRGKRARWVSRRVDREGRVQGAPQVLAAASPETHLLKLIDLGDELLVLFTEEDSSAGHVGAFSLSPAGQLSSPPQLFGRAARDVIWLDAVATGSTALVFWAERTGDNAVLFAARWGEGADLRNVARVHAEARAWQVTPSQDGALLAVVTPDAEVELASIDPSAKLVATRSLAESQGANADIDLVRHGQGLLLAFSRHEAGRDVIVSQGLSLRGEPFGAPVRVWDALESARVVRLLGSAGRALLVWRNADTPGAPMHAAWVGAEGRVGAQALNLFTASTARAPEFAANSAGVAVLLHECTAQDCERQPGVQWIEVPSSTSAEPPQRVQSWPSAGKDHLAWGLSCEAKACAGLSAELDDPIDVRVRTTTPALARDAQRTPLAAPAFPPADAAVGGPRVISNEQLVATPPLADLAGISATDGSLLSWVTQFDPHAPDATQGRPAPDGRPAPVQALLQTQWAPAGSKLPPPEVISYRARSLGGVALAQKGDRALLAWSALDGKSPQVFTTLLDAGGKRLRQAVQTTKQGEVFALDVAPLQAGWALGWIDDRTSRPLSYVTQVSDKLKRLSRDLQSPTLQGEARALLTRKVGEEAWLLVVDSNDEQDVLRLQRFDAKELQPIGPSLELLRSEATLSSPELLVSGERVWLLWIAGTGNDFKAWALPLDLRAEAESKPVLLAPHTSPMALGGACDEHDECHYWLSEKATGSAAKLASPRVFGGTLTLLASSPSQLWIGAEATPVPLVRGQGSELWLSAAGGGVSRARLEWLSSASN